MDSPTRCATSCTKSAAIALVLPVCVDALKRCPVRIHAHFDRFDVFYIGFFFWRQCHDRCAGLCRTNRQPDGQCNRKQ